MMLKHKFQRRRAPPGPPLGGSRAPWPVCGLRIYRTVCKIAMLHATRVPLTPIMVPSHVGRQESRPYCLILETLGQTPWPKTPLCRPIGTPSPLAGLPAATGIRSWVPGRPPTAHGLRSCSGRLWRAPASTEGAQHPAGSSRRLPGGTRRHQAGRGKAARRRVDGPDRRAGGRR